MTTPHPTLFLAVCMLFLCSGGRHGELSAQTQAGTQDFEKELRAAEVAEEEFAHALDVAVDAISIAKAIDARATALERFYTILFGMYPEKRGQVTPPPCGEQQIEDRVRALVQQTQLNSQAMANSVRRYDSSPAVLKAAARMDQIGKNTVQEARDLQTKQVMKGLEIAIKGYKTEYLRLPSVDMPTPTSDDFAYDTTDANGEILMKILLATDIQKNPRQIRFWEPPPIKATGAGYSASAGLRDPWGVHGYKIILDYSNDGGIADPEGGAGIHKADVLIYSAGPDGDFATWKDNVCSWKP